MESRDGAQQWLLTLARDAVRQPSVAEQVRLSLHAENMSRFKARSRLAVTGCIRKKLTTVGLPYCSEQKGVQNFKRTEIQVCVT